MWYLLLLWLLDFVFKKDKGNSLKLVMLDCLAIRIPLIHHKLQINLAFRKVIQSTPIFVHIDHLQKFLTSHDIRNRHVESIKL